jgi:hypothetical protein
VDIAGCAGMDEVYSSNFKLSVPGKTIYLNLERNEMKNEQIVALLQKVINGYCINTIGDKNLNRLLKKPNL